MTSDDMPEQPFLVFQVRAVSLFRNQTLCRLVCMTHVYAVKQCQSQTRKAANLHECMSMLLYEEAQKSERQTDEGTCFINITISSKMSSS